mgnify:FL=1
MLNKDIEEIEELINVYVLSETFKFLIKMICF